LALNTYIYEIPDPRQEKLWINDLAKIINPETENKLNQILTEINLKDRSEIVILTVPNVLPYQSLRQLAKYIFNIWHITRIGFIPLLSLPESNPYAESITAISRFKLLLLLKNRAILLYIKVLEFRNDKSFRSLTKEGYY
jgi:hypothetical protein